MTNFCAPGDIVKEFGSSEEVGEGVYLHDGTLRACITGKVRVTDLGGEAAIRGDWKER